jgi:hypothetical protein
MFHLGDYIRKWILFSGELPRATQNDRRLPPHITGFYDNIGPFRTGFTYSQNYFVDVSNMYLKHGRGLQPPSVGFKLDY